MMPSNKTSATPAASDAKPSRILGVKKQPGRKTKAAPNRSSSTARRGSKKAKILALLKRPGGVSLQQLQKATGWQAQAHSVRGFLSGTLKKKMGLRVHSAKLADGARTYRIASK